MSISTSAGIYRIDGPTGGIYIGSAVNLQRRWRSHKQRLNNGVHHAKHLQNAWSKYGSDAFTFSVVEFVDNPSDLLRIEQIWLDIVYTSLEPKQIYNTCRYAGSPLGVRHSEETRRKHSERLKGNTITRGKKLTEGHRKKVSEGLRNSAKFQQSMHSEHRRTQLRKMWANKSKEEMDAIGAKRGAATRGRERSLEHRQKLSAARKGQKMSEEARLKLVGRKTGPRSEEVKRKISQAQIGRKASPQRCDNQSRAHRQGKIITVIAPDGTTYEDIGSFAIFEKEHGLTLGALQNMLHGHKNRKGWRVMVTYNA